MQIRNFFALPFVRNLATVASGAATIQAINIGFAPVITRLYGPEAYGLQSIFMAVVGVFATIATLGYTTAMVLPRTDADAFMLGKISLYVGIAITVIVSVLIIPFGIDLLVILNAKGIESFIYLLPVAIMMTVLVEILGQWMIRKKAYKVNAVYGIVSALFSNNLKMVIGVFMPSALIMIVINLIGNLFGTVLAFFSWKKTNKQNYHDEKKQLERSKIWIIVKDYSDFPLLRTPQNLINVISQSFPIFLLANFFGTASAGHYSMAVSFLGIPSSLIGAAVMAVFYPKITEAINNNKDAKGVILKSTIGLIALGIIPFLVVIIYGPILFGKLFGQEWRAAGEYAQLLGIFYFFQYINKPAVASIPALRIQGGLLIYELFSTGSKIFTLWLGFAVFKDDLTAIALYSITGAVTYIWLIIWVIHRSKRSK